MSKHTPGPWTYTPAGCYVDDAGKPTSPVREFNINPVGVVLRVAPLTVDKAEANARLIAAAPQLVEALRMFDAWPEVHRQHGLLEAYDAARAALAAAGVTA